MTARSSNGMKVCMAPLTTTTPTIAPTAVAAVPAAGTTRAGVKVTAPVVAAVGEMVHFPKDFGFASLNDKYFVVTSATATDFTIGNLALGAGTMKAGATVDHYTDAEMICLCLSSISRSVESSNPIAVATICDPSATIPGPPAGAGSFSIAGFSDVTAADWLALEAAAGDGAERHFRITAPGNGYLAFTGVVNGWSEAYEIGGAQTWSASITLSGNPIRTF